jgi:hypothetical protein
MAVAESDAMVTMPSSVQRAGDESLVGRARWEEIRRLFYEERCSIARIARVFDLDRKTVRRCVRGHVWERRGDSQAYLHLNDGTNELLDPSSLTGC